MQAVLGGQLDLRLLERGEDVCPFAGGRDVDVTPEQSAIELSPGLVKLLDPIIGVRVSDPVTQPEILSMRNRVAMGQGVQSRFVGREAASLLVDIPAYALDSHSEVPFALQELLALHLVECDQVKAEQCEREETDRDDNSKHTQNPEDGLDASNESRAGDQGSEEELVGPEHELVAEAGREVQRHEGSLHSRLRHPSAELKTVAAD